VPPLSNARACCNRAISASISAMIPLASKVPPHI
jgi:hypothetical protein